MGDTAVRRFQDRGLYQPAVQSATVRRHPDVEAAERGRRLVLGHNESTNRDESPKRSHTYPIEPTRRSFMLGVASVLGAGIGWVGRSAPARAAVQGAPITAETEFVVSEPPPQLWFSPTGDDNFGTGWPDHPFRTPSRALMALPDGGAGHRGAGHSFASNPAGWQRRGFGPSNRPRQRGSGHPGGRSPQAGRQPD